MTYLQMDFRTFLSTRGVERDLRRLLSNLSKSAKYITQGIKASMRGEAGTRNAYGENQMALDVHSDKIILERLKIEKSFGVIEFASEEQGEIVSIHGEPSKQRTYSVATDPLDGSSLLGVNLSVGSIFGIHKGPIMTTHSGRETMSAAAYIVYGPETTMVFAANRESGEPMGVHEFVLDTVGNWVLKTENIRLKQQGSIYSPGGNRPQWLPQHREFIQHLEWGRAKESFATKTGYFESNGHKLRYSGGLVPDLNHILLKGGGCFTYPALTTHPNGKLRLLMELQPMAFIFEQAGGAATNGYENILDLVPETLEQRCPIYIGSKDEVLLAKEYLKEFS